jgi:hypothetical protein
VTSERDAGADPHPVIETEAGITNMAAATTATLRTPFRPVRSFGFRVNEEPAPLGGMLVPQT